MIHRHGFQMVVGSVNPGGTANTSLGCAKERSAVAVGESDVGVGGPRTWGGVPIADVNMEKVPRFTKNSS